MLDGQQRLILAGQPVTLPLRDLLISVQEIFCEILKFQTERRGKKMERSKILRATTDVCDEQLHYKLLLWTKVTKSN